MLPRCCDVGGVEHAYHCFKNHRRVFGGYFFAVVNLRIFHEVEQLRLVLHEDEDYANYPGDQKMLAFLFTFFVHSQKNRSRLVEFFPRPGCSKTLKPMRHRFVEFAKEIIEQGIEDGSIANRKKVSEKYPELLFEQFRSIIEFHRKDQSPEFQDTDALIEKSVRFSADMARSGTLDSAFDLGRFLMRRFTLPGS